MIRISLTLVIALFLTSCGGGGSNSGGGSFTVEDLFGRYEGTLGSTVRIKLNITGHNTQLGWPLYGQFRMTKNDGSCAFEGRWNAYPNTGGESGVQVYTSTIWGGNKLEFDGRSLKSRSGADNSHNAYTGSTMSDCSARVSGAVRLRKVG